MEIDLMPPELVKKKAFRRRQPFFGVAAAGIILIMLCWSAYTYQMLRVVREQIGKVRGETSTLQGFDGQLRSLKKKRAAAVLKADRVGDLIRLRTQWLEMLQVVHDKMFDGMWLTAIKPETPRDGGRITHVWVHGRAFQDRLKKAEQGLETTAVAAFLEALRDTPYFEKEGKREDLVEPGAEPGSYAREFRVRLALARPVVLIGEDEMPRPQQGKKGKKANQKKNQQQP
jgi:hypothetical protein